MCVCREAMYISVMLNVELIPNNDDFDFYRTIDFFGALYS